MFQTCKKVRDVFFIILFRKFSCLGFFFVDINLYGEERCEKMKRRQLVGDRFCRRCKRSKYILLLVCFFLFLGKEKKRVSPSCFHELEIIFELDLEIIISRVMHEIWRSFSDLLLHSKPWWKSERQERKIFLKWKLE